MRYALLLLGLITLTAQAHCIGTYGSIYSIAEPDMLRAIHKRLAAMQEDGAIDRMQQGMIKRARAHVLRPTPVSGVTDLTGPASSHYIDPSITIDHAIKLPSGEVIAQAGETINPLAIRVFHERLCFINGDNSQQISWVKHKASCNKVILVNGNIRKVTHSLGRRIYFDQFGYLCHRFKITHTPSVVFQPHFLQRLLVKEVQIA